MGIHWQLYDKKNFIFIIFAEARVGGVILLVQKTLANFVICRNKLTLQLSNMKDFNFIIYKDSRFGLYHTNNTKNPT